MKTILQTKVVAPLGTVLLVVAGYIGVAYYGSSTAPKEEVMKAGDTLGYCDVFYLSFTKPQGDNVVEVLRSPKYGTLWAVRYTTENDCLTAPLGDGYLGSDEEELKRNEKLLDIWSDNGLETVPLKPSNIHSWL